jgi:hypothetical protein
MKESPRGRRFLSDEEDTGEVRNWLKTQPKNFFMTELQKTCETLEPMSVNGCFL